MPKFRKRPIVIDAIQIPDPKQSPDAFAHFTRIASWADASAVDDAVDGHVIIVNTTEGDMKGRPGDWIIRGVEGEFYPCMDSVFQATYEEVS